MTREHRHSGPSPDCWCHPTVEVIMPHGNLLIIHNSQEEADAIDALETLGTAMYVCSVCRVERTDAEVVEGGGVAHLTHCPNCGLETSPVRWVNDIWRGDDPVECCCENGGVSLFCRIHGIG